jgi:cell division protein FtsB
MTETLAKQLLNDHIAEWQQNRTQDELVNPGDILYQVSEDDK